MLTLTKANPVPESPYRGVEPFRYIDQQIFAAREDETWNLLSSITLYRGVLLYGNSGSGKSSLINAGLIPALADERMTANILRVQPRAGKEIKIERIPTEKDREPPYLPSTFAPDEKTFSFELSIEEVLARLQELKKAPRGNFSDENRPLLIFDQFEEFVTLFEEAMHSYSSDQAGDTQAEVQKTQQRIIEALTEILQDESLPVKVLFVFREDYLAKLDILFENCPELLDQSLHLLAPRVEDARKIIRAPFENTELRAGFLNQKGETVAEITPELADTIAREMSKRSEGGAINLSELQIVCKKLYESSKPDALFKKEGVSGLLEQYWSDALNKFPDELNKPAVALLGHMITTSNTRNIISEDDLINREKENFPESTLHEALNALFKSRMVRREPRHQVYFCEIVSEFIVPWIQRLKAARKAEIERIAAQKQLKEAERRSRIWRWGVVGMAIILIAAIGAVIKFRQLNADLEQKRTLIAATNKQLIEAEARNRLLVTILTGSSSEEKIKAIEEAKRQVDSGQLPPEMQKALTNALLGISLTDQDQKLAGAASELLEKTVKSDDDLGKSIETVTSKLPPRVYIQIADNSQRTRASSIKLALERKRLIVPGFELVDSSRAAQKENELRYCPDTQGDQVSPADLLNDIKNADISKDWKLVPSRLLCAGDSRVRTNHLEIWFSKASTNDQTPAALGTFDFRVYVDKDYRIENTNLRVKVTMKSKTDPTAPVIIRETDVRRIPDILAGDYSVTVEASGFDNSGPQDVRVGPKIRKDYIFELYRKGSAPPLNANTVRPTQKPRAAESNQPTRRQNP